MGWEAKLLFETRQEQKIFSSSPRTEWLWTPYPASYALGAVVYPSEAQRPVRDTDLSTLSGSAVKNMWSSTSNLPLVILVCGIIKHKYNLTSTFNMCSYYPCVTTNRAQSTHYIRKIVKIPPLSNDYENSKFFTLADRYLSIRTETWVRIPGGCSYFIVITIFSQCLRLGSNVGMQ